MSRLPRRAFALLAGLAIIAAACSGSAATGAPGSTSVAGASNAPGGASVAAIVNPNDPSSIITQVLSGGSATPKSFHIEVDVNGTILAAAFQSAAGSATTPFKGDVKLDGSTIVGDVDLANQAVHLAVNLSVVSAGSALPITADVILKDSVLYYEANLLGPKYTKTDLGSLTGALTGGTGVAIPTAGPSALAGIQDQVMQIRQALDAAGAKATLVGVDQVGSKDAFHINISVPLDMINSQIAAAAASAAPGMKIDSASVDFWVYKDTYLPAKFEIKGASSTVGNFGLTVLITDYDKPVTITAPAASDIQAPGS